MSRRRRVVKELRGWQRLLQSGACGFDAGDRNIKLKLYLFSPHHFWLVERVERLEDSSEAVALLEEVSQDLRRLDEVIGGEAGIRFWSWLRPLFRAAWPEHGISDLAAAGHLRRFARLYGEAAEEIERREIQVPAD